jgi:outer membrane protein assembly factor BamB
MRKALSTIVVILAASPAIAGDNGGANWPQFRGLQAGGVAEGHSLPVKWDLGTGENIKWKTAIPGLAHSSPIIWDDKVFVTTAVSKDPEPYLKVGLYGESPKHEEKVEHEFRLLCLNKGTGAILWDKLVSRSIPRVQRHIKATHANSTPATDGKYVVAFFGSEGMGCFDMAGELKWYKTFEIIDSGPADATDLQWGFATSPVIHDGKLIVLVDARNESYLATFELESGKPLWRTMRPTYPGWHTPTVHVDAKRAQVITNGYKRIGGYDLSTGAELWWLEGAGDVPVPTPVVANDLIYITNAHGGLSPVYAIKTSATGDINLKPPLGEGESGPEGAESSGLLRKSEPIVWAHPRIGNYMQTPLVYRDLLYMCRDSGIMACYDAKTGEKKYRERLSSGVGFTASPVAGDGKVYFTSEEGDVFVIKAGDKYELLSKNSVGEFAMATPAISDGTMFWRTKGHVVAIGEKPKEDTLPANAVDKPKPQGEGG